MKRYLTDLSVSLLLIFLLTDFATAQETVGTIPTPDGFTRIEVECNSFADWLRHLPLKPAGTPVVNFRGKLFKAASDSALARVLDLDVAGRRLEQCMDIIIRLHAEYSRKAEKDSLINYPLPGGLWLSWPEWKNGTFVDWQNGEWVKKKSGTKRAGLQEFEKYLRTVFNLSSTQQFYFHLPRVNQSNLQAGDFIVKKGNRGHAVLILDICRNALGEKRVLIGQGDTPACGMYLLKAKDKSPWFKVNAPDNFPVLPIRKKMYWEGLRRFEK